jgi:hypothetical protein
MWYGCGHNRFHQINESTDVVVKQLAPLGKSLNEFKILNVSADASSTYVLTSDGRIIQGTDNVKVISPANSQFSAFEIGMIRNTALSRM